MPILSRVCNHPGCSHLIIAHDSCYMHNGKNVVHEKKQKSSIDANKRIISKSKDGTKEPVYRQCTHTQCKNIAKKFGVCYSHGAPRSMKSRRKNLQSINFMDMVIILINGVEDEGQYWVLSLQLQNADDPRLRWVALEMLKKGVGMWL